MTARDALLWFGVGLPICAVLLALIDLPFSPGRGRFVPVMQPKRARRWSRRRPTVSVGPVDARRRPSPSVTRAAGSVTAPAVAARSPRPVAVLEASVRPPRPVHDPWAPGDNLHRPISSGAAPSAATVRKRAWSAYATFADRATFDRTNVERLERGRPPLRYNPLSGTVERMDARIDDIGHVTLGWPDASSTVDPFAVEVVR